MLYGEPRALPGAITLEHAMAKRYITLPNRGHNLPFSDAVLVDDTLYISGRIGVDPVTGFAPEDVRDELLCLFAGFEAVLAEAEMTMENLVYVQVYCTDLELFDTFNAAYRQYFSLQFPARAFLGSGPLLLKGRFEMIGIARRG
jgi:2-iminobutanoate/2-iminopropanoate deaminase